MNDQLLQLTALFQKRLKEANLNVENSVKDLVSHSLSIGSVLCGR